MNLSPAFRRCALTSAAAISLLACTPPALGAAGRVVRESDTLLERGDAGRWQVVRAGAEVSAGRTLLALPTDRPAIDLAGGLRLTLLGSAPAKGKPPVWEAAVTLENAGEGTDIRLDSGRVVLANRNDKGDAAIRVRVRDRSWRLTLDPGAELGIEVYSRWAPGTFRREPGPGDGPTTAVIINALKGQADVQVDGEHFRMGAAPGPAYYHWDNVGTADRTPEYRDHAPEWSGAREESRFRLGGADVGRQLAEALSDRAPDRRRLAVFALAATDDLPRVLDALTDSHADVREAAVPALRHWIGRGVREDQALYQFLTRQRGYSAAQAEIVMQLLHGLSEDQDRGQPETYEALIAYLLHDKPAVRALAVWQLEHWVPQGKEIGYNPGGTDAERRRGYEEWKKLIPSGKLPPRPSATKRRG